MARVYQQIGQPEQAIAFWSQVRDRYQQIGNEQQLGRSVGELAQAYSSLGQHCQAIALLCGDNNDPQKQCSPTSAIAIAKKNADFLGEVAAKGSLGEAYRLRGYYTQAVDYLKDSLKIASILDNPQLEMSALNSLGSTYSSLARISYRQAASAETRGEIYGRTGTEYASDSLVMQLREDGKQQDKIALSYFEDSLAIAEGSARSAIATQQQSSSEQVRSLISSLVIHYRLGDTTAATQSKQQALDLISLLPSESTTVYATIDLAKLLQPEKVSFTSCYSADVLSEARALLQQAVDVARQIDNSRATSFALGELGHTYECDRDYHRALELTKEARLAAEQHKDSLYLWEWQTVRDILHGQVRSCAKKKPNGQA